MREVDLLTALLHELDGPLTAVVLDLDRLRANLRKLVRKRRVFHIARAELAGRRDLLPPLRRRTVSRRSRLSK
jgi:hypothetical protein